MIDLIYFSNYNRFWYFYFKNNCMIIKLKINSSLEIISIYLSNSSFVQSFSLKNSQENHWDIKVNHH